MMGESQIALGGQIRKLRRRAGLTQEQLAEKAGLSLKHLGEVERGRGNPTLSSLESLADALGVTLFELFDIEHERLTVDQIREEIKGMIETCKELDCRLFYRLLRVLTK